jgi:hypothetical protein
MTQIDETLRELDRWYNELPGGTERPKLISKLALLELCGWIEFRLDSLVHSAGNRVGLPEDWIDDFVVMRNHGFAYGDHLRKMLCRLFGESAMQHIETTFEIDHPGLLEKFKGDLTSLWKSRGVWAHTHSAAPVAQQKSIDAPSWTINQHRILSKTIDQFEVSLRKACARSIAAP